MKLFDSRGNVNVPVIAVLLVGVVFFAGMIFDGFNIIAPGTRGVSVRMGTISETPVAEGFTLKLPFVTTIHRVNIQQQTQLSTATCFSSDLQGVNIQVNVLYKLQESKVVQTFRDYKGDPYASLVEPRLQEVIKRETAKFSADNIVKSRDILKVNTLAELRSAVGETITIVDVTINNIDLSDLLEKAIENKMVFEQESLAMKFKLEKAKQEAEIAVVAATAEAKSIQIKGEAIAKNPDVLQIEMIKKWDGIAPKTLVTNDRGGANVVFPIERTDK